MARRHIQSAWAPFVIHILLPLITRSSVPRGWEWREGEREGGRGGRGGRERGRESRREGQREGVEVRRERVEVGRE